MLWAKDAVPEGMLGAWWRVLVSVACRWRSMWLGVSFTTVGRLLISCCYNSCAEMRVRGDARVARACLYTSAFLSACCELFVGLT